MKKYKTKLPTKYLDKAKEFDREKEKINGWGFTYDSEKVISKMEQDINNGIGIKKPLTVIVHKEKVLLANGCHRLAAGKRAGLEYMPVKVFFLEKLSIKLKKLFSKFVPV